MQGSIVQECASTNIKVCVPIRACRTHAVEGGGCRFPETRPFDVKAVELLKHCRRPQSPCTNHPLLIRKMTKPYEKGST